MEQQLVPADMELAYMPVQQESSAIESVGDVEAANLPLVIQLPRAEQWRMRAAMVVASTMGNRDTYKIRFGPEPERRAKESCLGHLLPPDLPDR